MTEIPLQPVANQSLSIVLDGVRYELTLKAANACVAATIVRDGVTLQQGVRLTPGTPVAPYPYQQTLGAFVFTTTADALADYEQFGITQRLYYATPDEIEQFRGA